MKQQPSVKTKTKSISFAYTGRNQQGQKMAGKIDSSSMAMAKAQLRKQGIQVERIKRQPKALFGTSAISFFGRNKAIKPIDIAVFVRQLATMMKAGVPLIQSFDIVGQSFDKPSMQHLVLQIKTDVQSGATLAQALAKHPRYFDGLVCSLVTSGEQSGTLDIMLERVASYKEKSEQLKAKIVKELTYPLAVIVVAIAVMMVLMIKVVPVFADMFASAGSDLPAFTQFVIGISVWIQKLWWILLLLILAGGWMLIRLAKSHAGFRHWLEARLLQLPLVGKLVYHAIIARFARTLATTFSAGVPLISALNYTAGATGNHRFYLATEQIRDEVASGVGLQTAMQRTQLFPNLAVQLVGVGEQAGSLEDMLDKVADYYEDKVDNALGSMTTLLEPMIMVVLGVLVGGLVIAMYLPIFQMGSVVG